jgi:hypothetical protein
MWYIGIGLGIEGVEGAGVAPQHRVDGFAVGGLVGQDGAGTEQRGKQQAAAQQQGTAGVQ